MADANLIYDHRKMYTAAAIQAAIDVLRTMEPVHPAVKHPAIEPLQRLLDQTHEQEGPMLTDYCDVVIYG